MTFEVGTGQNPTLTKSPLDKTSIILLVFKSAMVVSFIVEKVSLIYKILSYAIYIK